MNQPATPADNSVGAALARARQMLKSHPGPAAEQAREIIRVEPGIAEAHLILASALRRLDDDDGALRAEREALRVSTSDPVLKRAEEQLNSGREAEGELLIRRFLEDSPNDPEALRLLGVTAVRAGQLHRGEELARRSLALARSFQAARTLLDEIIERQACSYAGVEGKPGTPPDGVAEFENAIRASEKALASTPDEPKLWLTYGHVLRIAGRREESATAYRKAVELAPDYGEAWWSLADLKTVPLREDEIRTIRKQLESKQLAAAERVGLLFALGKALGDLDARTESFQAYAEGNALKRGAVFHDGAQVADFVTKCQEAFTSEFFAARTGGGRDDADPVFIVGMPRSGSTLVEQILASHPRIEGTEELIYMGDLAASLGNGRRPEYSAGAFIKAVSDLPAETLETIAGAYLWKSGNRRKSSRPHFIDKMPRNWLYLPLILLALPRARIIDVRRHPMDCCWSNFRQLFADSGEFSYDLKDLGGYYREYVRLMDHFDAALPGRVHRVIYEQLVADTETEVRRLLDYVGVPFDERCLRFHDNPRAVKTASSEQVRQPISRESIDQWRPYEAWLTPLKEALGSVVDSYPDVPTSQA